MPDASLAPISFARTPNGRYLFSVQYAERHFGTARARILKVGSKSHFELIQGMFKSFLMGGFECSTHRNGSRKRLDVIAASRHDEFAREDYQRLLDIGIGTARDGLRWHLIEAGPGSFDMSSMDAQIEAANATGLQVIWDLFHFGYPDHIDILSDTFPERFAAYGLAAITHLAR